jgi:phage terminase large subunit
LATTKQIEYQTYNAHSKQEEFHHAVSTNRVTLFNGGRGSGKTTAGAIQAILEAVQNQPGESGLIVAPTYGLIRKAALPELVKWLPRHWIKRFVQSPEIQITLTNDSNIHFGSAEHPDSLRGPNRAWLWMDEPRNMRTRAAFDIASAQIRRGDEKIWLTTTPSGIHHWLYDLFVQNPLQSSTYITVRTNENPHLSDTFKDQLRAQYTGSFAAQELDAMFVSFEGLVFDNFSLDENVTEEAEYNPDIEVYWGVDDGYANGEGIGTPGHHPRVILQGQLTPQGGLNIFDEYYQTLRLPEASIVEVLERGYQRPEFAMVDSSAPELRRRLGDEGIPNAGATHRISDGIKIVRRFICDGQGVRLLKVHPRCKNLIREMQMYRYDDKSKSTEAGEPKPLKMDDHTIDSLRYLIWNFR